MLKTIIKGVVQAVGASLVVGALYVFGLSFYGGYCQAFGLEESEFLLTIDRTLFYGFYVITIIVLRWLKLLLFVLFVASLIFFKFPWLRSHISGVLESVYVKAILVIFFASLAISVMASDAPQVGKETATDILKRIGQATPVEIYLSGRDQPVTGYPINWLCNATHCAFLIGKEVVVYQRQNIERIVSHPKLLQKDATPAAPPTK